jgi:hypothetical protein
MVPVESCVETEMTLLQLLACTAVWGTSLA